MRTTIIIACGLALWAVCMGFASRHGVSAAVRIARLTFLVLWLAAAALNLRFGVSRAGYTLGEELPIFLLIFAVPATVAVFVKFKRRSAPSG